MAERIIRHVGFGCASESCSGLLRLAQLCAGRGQNEGGVMKVVVVLSEAGCNLNLVLGLLRRGFRGIKKRPYCRDIFRVAQEPPTSRRAKLLRHGFNGFPSLLPAT